MIKWWVIQLTLTKDNKHDIQEWNCDNVAQLSKIFFVFTLLGGEVIPVFYLYSKLIIMFQNVLVYAFVHGENRDSFECQCHVEGRFDRQLQTGIEPLTFWSVILWSSTSETQFQTNKLCSPSYFYYPTVNLLPLWGNTNTNPWIISIMKIRSASFISQ